MSTTQAELETRRKPLGPGAGAGLAAISQAARVRKDAPGVQRYVRKTSLMVDPTYQRSANERKIDEIARTWSWVACGSICVSERPDGTYAVYDGQHRVLAAMKRDDIVHLPCIVFKLDDVSEEARGFLGTNAGRKPLTFRQRFDAMVIAEDPVAATVERGLAAVGYKFSGDNEQRHTTKCVGSIVQMYRTDPENAPRILAQMATVCDGAHMGQRIVLALRALAAGTHGDSLEPKWTRRMRDIGLGDLERAMQDASLYYKRSNSSVWARGILKRVNERIKEKLVWRSGEDAGSTG